MGRRPIFVHTCFGIAAVLALTLAGAGCGGEEPISSGNTTGAPTPAELAIPQCESVPELGTAADLPAPSTDPEVARWQASRAEVGLPSDEASTRAADADRATDMIEDLGFPMTQGEADAFFDHQTLNGALTDEVQSAVGGEPWFAGLWLDNVSRTIGVGVVGDVTAPQAELDAAFGPGAVVAASARHSQADLLALQAEVTAWLGGRELRYNGTGGGSRRNVVSVYLEVLDPVVVNDLAAEFGAEALCVEGAEPDEVVPEGPQPQAGDGWRLLANEPGVGVPYATGFAAAQAAYEQLWTEIGLAGEPPEVDFTTEVVAWFGPAVSGSCPEIRMDDVLFDVETAVLHPKIVLTGGSRVCTADANPHAYLVAVDRSILPDRFTVSIEPPNAECCPEGTTEADLTNG